MLLVQILISSGQLTHAAGHKKQVPSLTVSWSATLSLRSGGSPSVRAGNVVSSLRKSQQYYRHWLIKYTNLCILAFCSVWHCNLYSQDGSVFGVPKWNLGIMVHIHSRWAESCFRRLVHKGWFTLYVTFPFRRGTSPFSKIFSCVIKRRCSYWQERLRHVSVPFRRRCWARMFDITERVRTGLYLLDSDNVNSLTSPALHFECLRATSAACFCLQKWMKYS